MYFDTTYGISVTKKSVCQFLAEFYGKRPPRAKCWQTYLLQIWGAGVASWSSLSHRRFSHNHTHATEYVDDIRVGGQTFSVIFDTGSDPGT